MTPVKSVFDTTVYFFHILFSYSFRFRFIFGLGSLLLPPLVPSSSELGVGIMSSIMLTWIPREMASTLHGKGSGLVCFWCSFLVLLRYTLRFYNFASFARSMMSTTQL